nr:CYTH domain-containing protein [Endozoicomonas sp.]
MSQETELKLSLPENQKESLKNHPFWQEHGAQLPETRHLGNTYFDTADLRLNQARVALRIRAVNGQFIQTLKTRGESINGLTRRGEWEWPLTSLVLDAAPLAAVWPDELKDVAVESLKPVFTTDFDRTRWILHWQNPSARVEVALDEGRVSARGRTRPICELELELLDGDERALAAIARELPSFFDLQPLDTSKAERGFELLATDSD